MLWAFVYLPCIDRLWSMTTLFEHSEAEPTETRIFWKINSLVPSNFPIARETETKKTEQLCKSLILDWWNWSKQQFCINVLHNISWVMLRLCWCNWICAPYQVTFARFLLNPRAFFSRAFFLAFVQETWRKVETFGTKTHPRWIWNKTQRSVVIRSRRKI